MKNFSKFISFTLALSIMLGFGFNGVANSLYAADENKIEIAFNAYVPEGEVKITVTPDGKDSVSKTVSKSSETAKVKIEVDKIDKDKNYTIEVEQTELIKPDYDIVLKPATGKNTTMEIEYSTIKGKEVNESGLNYDSISISSDWVMDNDTGDDAKDYYKSVPGSDKKVTLKIPAKDILLLDKLNKAIKISADYDKINPEYTLKLDRGENPDLDSVNINLNLALYYKPHVQINLNDNDYKLAKAIMPPGYMKLCFNGDSIHKLTSFYIMMHKDAPSEYTIGVRKIEKSDNNDNAYLTVLANGGTGIKLLPNKVLASSATDRDSLTDSLENLRESNQDYKDIYASEGETILIKWPQKENEVVGFKGSKKCLNSELYSAKEEGVFSYDIEFSSNKEQAWGYYKIEDSIDAPDEANIEYLKDSLKINGIPCPISPAYFDKITKDKFIKFEIFNILKELNDGGHKEEYDRITNTLNKGAKKIIISYDIKVNKYGEYNNKARLYHSKTSSTQEFDEQYILELSEKSKLIVKKETYEKTKREDIKITDKDYTKAIIEYKNPFFKGYDGDIFKPENEISRAEIATVFARILGIEENQIINEDKFSDLKGHWAKNNIIRISEYGKSKSHIINGYPDGTFDPSGNITRAEFAKMIATYWDIKEFSPNIEMANISDLKDKNGNYHWAKDYILALYNHRFVDLYSDKSFKPDEKLKRAEVAQILNRITDRKPIKLNVPLYKDVPKNHEFYEEINAASSIDKK